MLNYYLDIEPNSKGYNCLHLEGCLCMQNKSKYVLIGNFNKLEDVIAESNSSDYMVSYCKECIDVNYNTSGINYIPSLFNRLQNTIIKWLHFVIRKKT